MTQAPQGIVLPAAEAQFAAAAPVAIVGAGACGLAAALAAAEGGAEVTVFERDAAPRGSTGLSSGFVPAAGTRWQAAKNIDDTPDMLYGDIMAKNGNGADPEVVHAVCNAAAPALEWLADSHGVPFDVLDSFLYPGHRRHRMHATPGATGAYLMRYLFAAVGRAGIKIETGARVAALFAEGGTVAGIRAAMPNGPRDIECDALVLACNGYGGAPDLIRRLAPEIADAVFIGHDGNTGDALRWGAALNAVLADLDAYQAHGAVTCGRHIMITWALMTEGGILVNAEGQRFCNEHEGVSEQAVRVLAQPDGSAWCIVDQRLHEQGMTFENYRDAVAAGEVMPAESVAALAEAADLPGDALAATVKHAADCARGMSADPLGRDFTGKPPLQPPYYTAKVTGALFHTQGGLGIDARARVLRRDGSPFPNLFAGGGAARGISGSGAGGYLPGNGLLTTIVLGRIAGAEAARIVVGGEG